MSQTGRLTDRHGVSWICTMPVGLVTDLWGRGAPQKTAAKHTVQIRKKNTSVGPPAGLSHTGGSAVPVGAAASDLREESQISRADLASLWFRFVYGRRRAAAVTKTMQ